MLDLSRRWGAGLYIVTENEGATVGIREGGNVKKCRPVVKEPSGGTLLFRCALPARGASLLPLPAAHGGCLCLGAACTGCIRKRHEFPQLHLPLPRRCLHGVHPGAGIEPVSSVCFASALPARGASRTQAILFGGQENFASALPARGASAKADKLRHTIL